MRRAALAAVLLIAPLSAAAETAPASGAPAASGTGSPAAGGGQMSGVPVRRVGTRAAHSSSLLGQPGFMIGMLGATGFGGRELVRAMSGSQAAPISPH